MNASEAPAGLAAQQAAIEAYLAAVTGADGARIETMTALTGGAIQENWALQLVFEGGLHAGPADLVLRTDAASAVASSRPRAEEFALLRAAHQAGVPTPEPLWLCEDTRVLGKPFYVMRRIAGIAAGHKLTKPGALSDPDALAEQLGSALARIHSIRPPREDLAFLGAPTEHPALAAVAILRGYLDDLPTAHPDLEWGLRWCERAAPTSEEVVLVHQDFRTGNYLVEEGALTAVLDWEFAAWGDPMSDIGWFCAKCWRFGQEAREAGGIAAREPFYRAYEATSGRQIDHNLVEYWETIAHLRWATIALMQGERFNSGGEASMELALTGRLKPVELAREILARTAPQHWDAGS